MQQTSLLTSISYHFVHVVAALITCDAMCIAYFTNCSKCRTGLRANLSYHLDIVPSMPSVFSLVCTSKGLCPAFITFAKDMFQQFSSDIYMGSLFQTAPFYTAQTVPKVSLHSDFVSHGQIHLLRLPC
jgi:hypothetical protein